MPSMLHRLHRHDQVAAVVDLDAARAFLRGDQSTQVRTLLIRCATQRADEEVIRYLGVDADSTLEDMQAALDISFTVPSHSSAPARFTQQHGDSGRLDLTTTIGDYLTEPGDILFFHWGLWQFTLVLSDVLPRDTANPRALCVAGDGEFGGHPFDIAAINDQLHATTGRD